MSEHRCWLSEAQVNRLNPLLPNKVRGVPRVEDRKVLSGIVPVIRSGLLWRDAPACSGPPKPLSRPPARIFISDSLENGAGYSTHLGAPDEFEALLKFMLGKGGAASDQFFRPIADPPHCHECLSSCHRCLRDYGNMPYHPLLDWRLAMDMARLALDAMAQIDLNTPCWKDLIRQTADPYFEALGYRPERLADVPAGHDSQTNAAVILIHPLWDTRQANFHPVLAAAVAEAEARGWQWKLRSVFRAVRFPYE